MNYKQAETLKKFILFILTQEIKAGLSDEIEIEVGDYFLTIEVSTEETREVGCSDEYGREEILEGLEITIDSIEVSTLEGEDIILSPQLEELVINQIEIKE